jgi:hypothetical protein
MHQNHLIRHRLRLAIKLSSRIVVIFVTGQGRPPFLRVLAPANHSGYALVFVYFLLQEPRQLFSVLGEPRYNVPRENISRTKHVWGIGYSSPLDINTTGICDGEAPAIGLYAALVVISPTSLEYVQTRRRRPSSNNRKVFPPLTDSTDTSSPSCKDIRNSSRHSCFPAYQPYEYPQSAPVPIVIPLPTACHLQVVCQG